MTDLADLKWDRRFIEMAEMVSTWSKDPSTQCGAVIVRPDRSVVSVGFNGFPRRCDDHPNLYAHRELKLERVVHAEVNAVMSAREHLRGCTLYTWPPGLGPSCARCTGVVIQSGITRVCHVRPADTSGFNERWRRSVEIGLAMYREAGVEVVSVP